MPHRIYWTDAARKSFSDVLDYLAAAWGQKQVDNLIHRTEIILRLVSENPNMYSEIIPSIRRCVLTKHNSLFIKSKAMTSSYLPVGIIEKIQKKLLLIYE